METVLEEEVLRANAAGILSFDTGLGDASGTELESAVDDTASSTMDDPTATGTAGAGVVLALLEDANADGICNRDTGRGFWTGDASTAGDVAGAVVVDVASPFARA